MNIELSCNGNVSGNVTWNEVENALSELKKEAFFRLSIMPWPKTGPVFLEIESEDGNYMPSMLVRGGINKVFVNEDGRDKEDVTIGGYDVDAMAVTQDFDLIVRMIKEFYETGDISPELLK